MPNWAEGTIKFRGSKDNVIKFLSEGIHAVSFLGKDIDGVEIYVDDVFGDVNVEQMDDDYYIFHINDTKRAFIEKEDLINSHFSEFYETDEYIIELSFKQAWDIKPDEYQKIADKYDLDIHIFAYESGIGFTHEVEIVHHELSKDITNKYEYQDYQWNIPFTNIGG